MSELPKGIGHRESLIGLPEELVNSLVLGKRKLFEKNILSILEYFDGVASVDEIIIRYYRKFNIVRKKQYIHNVLLAMTKERKIKRLKGKKSIYCLLSFNEQ